MGYPGGSGSVTVTPEELAAASGTIDGIKNEIAGILSNLRSIVDGSSGSWKGASAQKFQLVSGEWDRSQQKLQSSLDQITQDLATNGKDYSATEDDSVHAIGAVAGNSGLAGFS